MVCPGKIPAGLMDTSDKENPPRKRIPLNVDSDADAPLPPLVNMSWTIQEGINAASSFCKCRILNPIENM